MIQEFKRQQKWQDVDPDTQRTYEQGAKLFADHILKDGSGAGSKQVGDFTKAFVDAVYAKLLVVESLDAQGNVVRRERRRMAIAAMGACRRAWFVMQRTEEAPLFDETGKELFPEMMSGLDAIKEQTVSGLVFRRDDHRRGQVPFPG